MSKRKITSEDLYSLKNITDPQLSPCGGKLVFVKTTINDEKKYESHLFMQSLADHSIKQWTFGNVRDQFPRWSPCGNSIVFVSNRSGASQLWLLPVDGGEAQQLTKCKNGASSPSWSPDGKQILFVTSLASDESINDSEAKKEEDKEPKPLVVDRLKYKSDDVGFVDEKCKQLALLKLEDHSITQLTTHHFDHSPGAWSPDGSKIAFTSNQVDDYQIISDLFVMKLDTKEIEMLTESKGIFHTPAWAPNGVDIACYGHELEYAGATLSKIWKFNSETGNKECLTANWDVHTGDVAIGDMRSGHPNPGPIWAKDVNELVFLASKDGNTGLFKVDGKGNVFSLYEKEEHVYGLTIVPEVNDAILAISHPTNPGDLYKFSLETSELTQLTAANADFLNEIELSQPEVFNSTSKDGGTVPGWLMKPTDFDKEKKYPMILEIHGGPHAMYGNTFFHELQLLTANGYVVLYTNPRGSHGYGQKFVDACRGDYGGMDYEDLMSAVDHALETFTFIDKERLGVTGGSYGGFMTNWIVGHTNRFKAAVTLRSISNWISFYGVSDIGYFFSEWEIGTTLLDDPDKLWKHSPLRYVNNIETPLLILHGERDYRCPVEQAEQLYVALKHRKKDTRLVRFPNSNHELSRSGEPKLRIERLEHIINWFNEKI